MVQDWRSKDGLRFKMPGGDETGVDVKGEEACKHVFGTFHLEDKGRQYTGVGTRTDGDQHALS